MADLVIDRLWCQQETNEAIGDDDIYAILFRGRTIPPFVTKLTVHGPSTWWQNVSDGDIRHKDVALATVRSDTEYVVMLVEQDNSTDISGDEVLGMWRSQTDLMWKSMMISVLAANGPTVQPTESQRASACKAIATILQGLASVYMEFPKGNDDVISIKRIIPPTAGTLLNVDFKGDGGHYTVRFKVV